MNQKGDPIAAIDDLIIDPRGRIERMLLAVGGFLGIAEKLVAVDFSELRFETQWSCRTIRTRDGTERKLAWESRPAVIFEGGADQLHRKPAYTYTKTSSGITFPLRFDWPLAARGRARVKLHLKRTAEYRISNRRMSNVECFFIRQISRGNGNAFAAAKPSLVSPRKRILNPSTKVYMAENGHAEMELTQLGGVDEAKRCIPMRS